MNEDLLEYLPRSNWSRLQEEFKKDWPRGAQAYYALETQRKWCNIGLDYGFKVYCPFGNVKNGMVAINEKGLFYEIIIQCSHDDTSILEKAIRATKVIDWTKPKIVIPFSPEHMTELFGRILTYLPIEVDHIIPSCSFIYDKTKPAFEISLPKDCRFSLLTQEHVPLVDGVWPHRYHSSQWFFSKLIEANSGYGLYVNDVLVCWAFIYEVGTLGHLFTIEGHRRKGYGKLMLKLMTNEVLSRHEDVLAFTVTGNASSIELFTKLGYVDYGIMSWILLHPKETKDD